MKEGGEAGVSEKPNDLDGRDVLVVGGAGYIGAVLVPHLLGAGARVRILDGLIYGNGYSIQHLLDDDRVSFHLGDIAESGIFEHAARDVTDVVLLASLVGDPICKKYPNLALRTNVHAALSILDSLDKLGIDRFVFLSTCSNYGLLPEDVLATEESELNPQSLYARTKIQVEEELIRRGAAANYAGTILRLATAYGLSPRMRFDLTISQFTREIAIGQGLVVYDADTWRPYCHVRDIAKSILTVLSADRELIRNEIFNVGDTSEQFTKRMIVDEISQYVPNAKVEFRSGDTDPRNYRVSFSKIGDKLLFRTDLSVREHIPRLIGAIGEGIFPDTVGSMRFGNHGLIPAYQQIEEDLARLN